jgi:fibronectin-binding autotransporter adhesin
MKNILTMNNQNIIRKIITSGCAIVAAHLLSTNGSAQTYTWADNAQGQLYLTCFVSGFGQVKSYWPSNSLWSQSLQMSGNCDNSAQVVSQPSNFNPAPPIGVYPGGPGAVGVDVVLGAPANTIFDVDITLNSLTIKTNGGVLGFGGNVNVTANTFDFQRDGSLTNGGGITIASGGTLVKSGGTGTFDFGSSYAAVSLTGHSPTIEVKSGTLVFPAGNNDTTLDGGGTFAISNNATLILAPDNNTGTFLNGDFTGVGGGTVLLNAGMLDCGDQDGPSSLNLPGNMFQWIGGQLAGTVTNYGTINVSNNPAMNASVYNNGMIKLAEGSAPSVNNFCYNQTGGIIDLTGDAGLAGVAPLVNSGLLKKSAGAGWSLVFPQFENFGGTVEVDSGTLAVGLNQNDSISNATFVVHNGATFDLSISNQTTTLGGVLTGSGGGTVFMNNGSVLARDATTLNFPGSMFQLAGGALGGEASTLTNAGTINLTGPAGLHSYFVNNGTIIESGAGDNNDNSGQIFNNGTYQIQNDNGAANNYFYNYGLLEKTGGSGTSVISATFNNSGAIQPASGTLLFTGGFFYQNAGTLQITPAITFTNEYFYLEGGTVTGVGTVGDYYMFADGGVLAPGNPFGTLNVSGSLNIGGAFNVVLGGPNQFSQLAVSGGVGVNYNAAALNVTLTNGYVPAIGTQFQIISSASVGGGFATLNVPAGISVNYSNSGVYLIVTGSTPVKLQSPKISGGNFVFNFATTNGLGYTVQQNTNLATSNWIYFTNLIGNGSLYQFTTPITNISQNFFRVRQP